MNNLDKYKSSADIKAQWNERLEKAEDKGLEVANLTAELSGAIAMEKAEAFLESAKSMIKNSNAKNEGMRLLSKDETEYYKQLSEKINNPKQALTVSGNDIVMPETIVNRVFDDLKKDHPLLKYIDIAPAGLKKWLISESDGIAGWGSVTEKITKEISATVKEIQLDTHKITAYFPIHKGIVDLGYEWLDKFIRTVIAESLYVALEKGIIAGDGKNTPIGMMKNVEKSSNGVYAEKTAIKLADLSPQSYGNVVSELINGGKRTIKNLIMIVNPVDYLQKVLPAIAFLTPNGEYTTAVPYPTVIIESTEVPTGKAVLGLGKNYLLGVSSVKVEVYKELLALDDQYLYLGKAYGNGRPKDNSSFIVLDISALKPIGKDEVSGGIVQ